MSWRSWVDDCPSGILANCAMDIPQKRVLTQTQAAYENYDQMLGQSGHNSENFTNFPRINRKLLLLLFLFILGLFFILANKKIS